MVIFLIQIQCDCFIYAHSTRAGFSQFALFQHLLATKSMM
jgi:hypothetical protein